MINHMRKFSGPLLLFLHTSLLVHGIFTLLPKSDRRQNKNMINLKSVGILNLEKYRDKFRKSEV